MECRTFALEELTSPKYVVVFTRYRGKLLLSRHRQRDTWETQGGHIEPGETPEQAARAFEPFYKADQARTRQAGGAGLGLTLCRQIAQLHGGTLSLTSAPGKGTEVRYHNGKEN